MIHHYIFFLTQHQLNREEYIMLLLALVPHVHPNFLDNLIQTHLPQGGDFAEMGGVKGNNHRGMLPTGETVQFILAGSDLEKRLCIQKMLQDESILVKENILWLEQVRG